MKTAAKIAMALAGMAGIVASAVAENRGLSPIIGPLLLLPIALNNLMAVESGAGMATTDAQQTDTQGLLDYALTLIEGEELMFTLDVPVVPPLESPIVLAQAAAPAAAPQPDFILNACKETESTGDPSSAMRTVDPAGMLATYLQNHNNRTVTMEMLAAIKTTLLQDTMHGKITSVIDNTGRPWYAYDAEPDYIGNDKAVFMAEFEGKRYKIVVELHVFRTVNENNPTCPEPQLIKVTKPASGASSYGSDYYNLASVFVTFADLPGSAVGQTIGSNITLDTSAAGHGWYVDANPWDNSEYLATSNPYEWVARAGSAAEGKMDLLSVLLHEYGHALGIEHSMDSHDYMATTLTPGVRRLPSAEELALMQRLVEQVKEGMVADSTLSPTLPLQGGGEQDAPNPALPLSGGFLAFLGRRKESGFGVQDVFNPQPQVIRPQYAVAANAAFTGLDSPMGWNTLGSVGITNNAATLNEVSATHTRLSQVFTVNAKDRYLTFTLSGAALDDLTGAPDDAFEAALLDASTGLSLLGGIGLTRSDAFLNLQADGAQNLANCVTCSDNPDGSRTYRVDLSGITAGTVANLSFDLIGFGQNGSRLTLSDVRVSGLPQLQDEAATMLEDGSLAFDPYAQADAQLRPMLAANVVDAPLHGVITVNGDGTFSYTPDLDYAGSDSFTYRLADGPLESNLATVSITLTAVNDAPVAADVQLSANEDAALTITLGAYASDVDSATLTPVIVTGPAHGTLTQNADGSFTYTPDANYNGADSFTYLVNDGALDSNVATVSLAIASVNDAPQGTDNTVATLEDTDYVFTVADFGFSDAADGNSLAAVHIMDIPLAGSLMLNGVAVTAGQAIGVADIAAGLLVFEESQKSKGQTQIFPGQ